MAAPSRLLLGLVLLPLAAFAQKADDPSLVFEVASVKPHVAAPGEGNGSSQRGGPGTDDPGRITATNRMLRSMIIEAWGIRSFQIDHSAFPWMGGKRYDVVAKVPPGTTKEQARAMMRNLLTERFALQIRREERQLPVYDLVVAKGGLKMKANAEDPPPQPDSVDAGYTDREATMTVKRQTLSRMVTMLTDYLDRPVINRTGLKGNYDYTLHWSFEPGVDADFRSGIANALAQIGLKLDSRKEPVNILVVVSAREAPTEN